MAGEWADPKRRGFTTSFAQMGAPLGLVLANGSLSLMTWLVGDEALIQWGWRLPFLASIVLVGIGLYVRMGVLESPVFARLKDLGKVAHAPVLLVIQENWREIALSTLLRTGQLVPYYVFTTYILSYGTRVLGLAAPDCSACLSLRSLTSIVAIRLPATCPTSTGARRSSRQARRHRSVLVHYAQMLATKAVSLVFLAMVIDSLLQDLQYAPQAALIAENFPASRRYSGSGLGYHLASITAGGPAPIIATSLYQRYQSPNAIAAFVLVSAVISLATLLVLKDHSGDLDHT